MATTTARMLPVRSTDDIQWRVAPGWERELIGPSGLRLSEWLASGQARVVKDGPHRTVYRVDLPAEGSRAGRAFYVKHYRATDWSGGRNLFRQNPSRREWQRADELARRDIPTITPVALGERRQLGVVTDSFLVSEAIPSAQSLLEWTRTLPSLPAGDARPLRRRLVLATARLCAALHQSGAEHDDLHAENILVSGGDRPLEDEEIPPVHLIDVPGVRFTRSLSWRASRNSLAMLAVGLMDHSTPGERWLFLREYLRRRPELAIAARGELRHAAAATLAQVHATALRVAKGRDRRVMAQNKDFHGLRTTQGTGQAVRDLSRETLAALIADPCAPFVAGIESPVKLSHSSVVVKSTLKIAGQTIDIAYKRSRPKNLTRLIGGWLRPERALRGWRMGHALAIRGIATPRPLAVVRSRGFFKWPETWLATEWIAGGLDLHSYFWRLEERTPDERDASIARTAEALGRLLGRMHAWNVSHRDLKANNLLIVERDGAVEPWLVDLDGVRILARLSEDRRARDLARLAASLRRYGWLSRTAPRRFLRAYLRTLGRSASEWKTLWRAVARHAAGIQAKW